MINIIRETTPVEQLQAPKVDNNDLSLPAIILLCIFFPIGIAYALYRCCTRIDDVTDPVQLQSVVKVKSAVQQARSKPIPAPNPIKHIAIATPHSAPAVQRRASSSPVRRTHSAPLVSQKTTAAGETVYTPDGRLGDINPANIALAQALSKKGMKSGKSPVKFPDKITFKLSGTTYYIITADLHINEPRLRRPLTVYSEGGRIEGQHFPRSIFNFKLEDLNEQGECVNGEHLGYLKEALAKR